MQKVIHGPGIVPTFLIGSNSPFSDGSPSPPLIGIRGGVPFPLEPLYTFIDEQPPPDDDDYIRQGLGNIAAIYSCSCGPVPVAAAGTILAYYRVRRMGGTGAAGSSAFLRLSRGGTPIHTETITPLSTNMPLDFTTFTVTLSGAERTALFAAAGNIGMGIDGAGFAVPGVSEALEFSWMHLDYFA